jgi:hypothetical protein
MGQNSQEVGLGDAGSGDEGEDEAGGGGEHHHVSQNASRKRCWYELSGLGWVLKNSGLLSASFIASPAWNFGCDDHLAPYGCSSYAPRSTNSTAK